MMKRSNTRNPEGEVLIFVSCGDRVESLIYPSSEKGLGNFCKQRIGPFLYVEKIRQQDPYAKNLIRLMEHQMRMEYWEDLIRKWNSYQRSYSNVPELVSYEICYHITL